MNVKLSVKMLFLLEMRSKFWRFFVVSLFAFKDFKCQYTIGTCTWRFSAEHKSCDLELEIGPNAFSLSDASSYYIPICQLKAVSDLEYM